MYQVMPSLFPDRPFSDATVYHDADNNFFDSASNLYDKSDKLWESAEKNLIFPTLRWS